MELYNHSAGWGVSRGHGVLPPCCEAESGYFMTGTCLTRSKRPPEMETVQSPGQPLVALNCPCFSILGET